MTGRLREVVRGLAATAVLLVLVVGPPLLLSATVGWPLPQEVPSWSEVGDALGGSTVSDSALLKALACACWFMWFLVVASIVEELAAWIRGRSARRLPAGGALQPVIRQLVMAATLLLAAAKSTAAPTALPSTVPANVVIDAAPVQQPALDEIAQLALPHCLVQPRDSLWKLAEDHLGDGMRWRELWELNRDRAQVDGRVFKDPNLIHPGWKLTMPADAVGLGPAVPEPPPVARDPLPLPPVNSPPPTTTTTIPPTTTTERQQAEPDVDAPDDSADDPDFEVVPILAGAALVAAGVVSSIDRLRRRQLRHRTGDRSIRLPGRGRSARRGQPAARRGHLRLQPPRSRPAQPGSPARCGRQHGVPAHRRRQRRAGWHRDTARSCDGRARRPLRGHCSGTSLDASGRCRRGASGGGRSRRARSRSRARHRRHRRRPLRAARPRVVPMHRAERGAR